MPPPPPTLREVRKHSEDGWASYTVEIPKWSPNGFEWELHGIGAMLGVGVNNIQLANCNCACICESGSSSYVHIRVSPVSTVNTLYINQPPSNNYYSNVPLFKKLRDIIFFLWDNNFEPFRGTFWGGQKSQKMAHKVIVPQKKIWSQSFLNSGTLVFLCTRVLLCTVVVCCCLLLGVLVCCCVLLRVSGVGRSPCSYVV